jgi:hypothetical protein
MSPIDPGKVACTTFREALALWQKQESSNLLLVMGAFGAGKTTGLTDFSAQDGCSAAVISFEQMLAEGILHGAPTMPNTRTVIVDNFDAINDLSGRQIDPPDLRAVASLARTHRVVLATRRSLGLRSDELLAQVSSEQRLSNIGFKDPVLVNLIPWKLKDLRDFSVQQDPTGTDALALTIKYLEAVNESDAEGLCRPMLILMLMRLASRPNGLSGRPTLASIYREFCSVALASDYDMSRSRISGLVKEEILSELAYDIFAGISQSDSTGTPSMSLPIERVSERVLEVLMRSDAFRKHKGIDSYSWTEDFIGTNHVLSPISATGFSSFANVHYGFVHQSFYEYFVGHSLCRRISNGKTLGLEIERLSMATVDSLAMAFVRELGGADLRNAVRSIVARPRLTSADRLVLLFLLEDEADFSSILESMPPEYLDELEKLGSSVKSFLLKKMVWYQLVISGRLDASAYVQELRKQEDQQALQAEVRLHSSETGAVNQLLLRLRNPALARARLITIYRLGQLGDERCVDALEWIAAGSDSPSISAAVASAIAEIRERLKERK